MIIVDTALRQRAGEGRPIRVGLVGAGMMGRGIALQLARYTTGMRVAAIANRRLQAAMDAYRQAGIDKPQHVQTVSQLERAVESGVPAVTDDALLLSRAAGLDALVEATGTIEHAARVTLEAIAHRKHVILMNAELDGTVGPILRTHAARAGVVLTSSDGDQPGVMMNLLRFVRGIGVRPVLCGNIKGLLDRHRDPSTQAAFAEKWGQSAEMAAASADGTKLAFENAVVANGTGMKVGRRGMFGPSVPEGTPLQEAVRLFPSERLLQGDGVVDYVVGAAPAPGVFVLGAHDDPRQRSYLSLYKLGDGPIYCFYTPYHLCHFEVPNTIARAVLFNDATLTPMGAPCVEVVATAKRKLEVGEVIDGLGGYMTYGLAENASTARVEDLLPIGLALDCRLKRTISQDSVLTSSDVEFPPGRLCDRLWRDQLRHFGLPSAHQREHVS